MWPDNTAWWEFQRTPRTSTWADVWLAGPLSWWDFQLERAERSWDRSQWLSANADMLPKSASAASTYATHEDRAVTCDTCYAAIHGTSKLFTWDFYCDPCYEHHVNMQSFILSMRAGCWICAGLWNKLHDGSFRLDWSIPESWSDGRLPTCIDKDYSEQDCITIMSIGAGRGMNSTSPNISILARDNFCTHTSKRSDDDDNTLHVSVELATSK